MAIPRYRDVNGQFTKTIPFFANGTDGWFSLSSTFTYSTSDSSVATNGTMYTATYTLTDDITSKVSAGARIKFLHSGIIKYAIVVDINSATIILLLPIGTTISSGAISNIYYSHMSFPVGFPVNPDKWTIEIKNTTNFSKVLLIPPTLLDTGISITTLIGKWHIIQNYSLYFEKQVGAEVGVIDGFAALSYDKVNYIGESVGRVAGSKLFGLLTQIYSCTTVTYTEKKIHYLCFCNLSGVNATMSLLGEQIPSKFKAVCAYL